MRTISVNIYKFDELSDDAKAKVREWHRNAYEARICDDLMVDAEKSGLQIGFNIAHQAIQATGKFIINSGSTANKIIKNDDDCETTKVAFDFLENRRYDNEAKLAKDFLNNLLNIYSATLTKALKHYNEHTDEVISENSYWFYENGDYYNGMKK